MRLASGIAPVRKMLDAGVNVGLGVDGSASNDSGHMMAEARQAMLLQRVGFGPAAMTAREALTVATRGSAKVLNRDYIGYLAPGMSADIIAYDLNALGFAGGQHDPLAALLFCAAPTLNYSIVNGKVVVNEGRITTIDTQKLIPRHNALSKVLIDG